MYTVFITSALCYLLITWTNIHLSATLVTAFWPAQVCKCMFTSGPPWSLQCGLHRYASVCSPLRHFGHCSVACTSMQMCVHLWVTLVTAVWPAQVCRCMFTSGPLWSLQCGLHRYAGSCMRTTTFPVHLLNHMVRYPSVCPLTLASLPRHNSMQQVYACSRI